MADTPYTKITYEDAFQRNLHHGGVETRMDSDGVERAYHQATQTYWDVPTPPRCPWCGESAPYGDARISWLFWHEGKTHRVWQWLKRKARRDQSGGAS